MPHADDRKLIAHDVRDVDEINILFESDQALRPNIYIYSASVRPLDLSFEGVESVLVSMVVAGILRGKWKTGNLALELALLPGSVSIVPPELAFDLEFHSHAEVINIYVSQKILRDIGIDFSSQRNSRFDIAHNIGIADPFMEQTILSIKELVEKGGTFSKIEIEYLVRVLVSRIISRYSTLSEPDLTTAGGLPAHILQKTLDSIDQNLHRRISVERLAAAAGIGAAQFSRLFKRAMGVTLHQYIICQRIERARQMLTETDMPIAEIAHECGFADQVHLTRFFGRLVGASLASFRRKARG